MVAACSTRAVGASFEISRMLSGPVNLLSISPIQIVVYQTRSTVSYMLSAIVVMSVLVILIGCLMLSSVNFEIAAPILYAVSLVNRIVSAVLT